MANYTTKPEQVTQRWLSCKDAAKYAGISYNRMLELFRRNDFPAAWIGQRQRVLDSDLNTYIKEGRAG